MLRDLSISVSPILALLLIVLTPVGTGTGAHRDQLLDPLFPHVHLGAGAGAAPVAVSMGITPPVPAWLALVPCGAFAWDVAPLEAVPPTALAEPPPDPPPTRS